MGRVPVVLPVNPSSVIHDTQRREHYQSCFKQITRVRMPMSLFHEGPCKHGDKKQRRQRLDSR